MGREDEGALPRCNRIGPLNEHFELLAVEENHAGMQNRAWNNRIVMMIGSIPGTHSPDPFPLGDPVP